MTLLPVCPRDRANIDGPTLINPAAVSIIKTQRLARPNDPAALEPVSGVGCQWIVDAHRCDRAKLRDRDLVDAYCRRVVNAMRLHVLGTPQSHAFGPPGYGVTVLYLLTQSHLAIHTYPESGLLTLNLVCCRDLPDWSWRQSLRDTFDADDVEARRIDRGERC